VSTPASAAGGGPDPALTPGPGPAPVAEPAAEPAKRPEVLVGAAFAGGVLAALLLKRAGRV